MVIAIDFDGTLAVTDFPTIISPIQKTFDFAIERQSKGDKIILWTCRGGKYLKDAVEFCEKHGLVFDAINDDVYERIWTRKEDMSRKINADLFIDDKAINVSRLEKIIFKE